MKMPHFVLWKWCTESFRTEYQSKHVNQMCYQMINAGVPQDRIVCITDDPSGVTGCRTFPLWPDHGSLPNISGQHLPSCYRRLKLFSRQTQEALGIQAGERIVSFDLDAVILQKFLGLFDRPESEVFVGWHVPGTRHPAVLNGSIWMFTAGKLEHLWEQFEPHKSPANAVRLGYMGSDQGYLSQNLIGRDFVGKWTAKEDGIMSYMRDVFKPRCLARHTRVVFFPGRHKPWHDGIMQQNQWIRRYLCEPPQPIKDELLSEAGVA